MMCGRLRSESMDEKSGTCHKNLKNIHVKQQIVMQLSPDFNTNAGTGPDGGKSPGNC